MGLINYITQVQFDFGAIRLARSECERSAIARPLICTDKGVVAAGLLDRLREALGRPAGGRVRRDAVESDRGGGDGGRGRLPRASRPTG